MVEVLLYGQGGDAVQTQVGVWKCLWQWLCIFYMVLASHGLLPSSARAAEPSRPIRIGVLTLSWGHTPQVEGLREGLRALGYRSEQLALAVRFTQGNLEALPTAAQQLVQYGPDIIFADADEPAKAVRMATAITQIPVVFASVGDPVMAGLVQSYARPGGNMTGVVDQSLKLGSKRLAIFREIVPGLKRVLYLYAAADTYAEAAAGVYRNTAHHLGIEMVERVVHTEEEARAALTQDLQPAVDGILAPPSLSLNIPGFIVDAASQWAIPTMFSSHGTFFVKHGGLASYGPDDCASGQQAARLVDKILKGADPAMTPVETNPQIEFTLNLKVAESLKLTIAPEVLYQATHIFRAISPLNKGDSGCLEPRREK